MNQKQSDVGPGVRAEFLLWMLVLAFLCGLFRLMATLPDEEAYSRRTYPMLGRAFLSGHTYLPQEVPQGLKDLPDPWDPDANFRYRRSEEVWDWSYHKGRYYLYFGPVPAVVCFAPYRLLTGEDLTQTMATVLFCTAGSTALVFLWWRLAASCCLGLWPRLAGALPLVFCSGCLTLLRRVEVYEVCISGGFCFVACALASWGTWFLSDKRGLGRLALTGACAGLALGCRPSLLPGVALLCGLVLLHLLAGLREGRAAEVVRRVAAFAGPLCLIGLALAVYNQVRFDSWTETGHSYQMAAVNQSGRPIFSRTMVPDSLFAYLLQPPSPMPSYPFFGYPDFRCLPVLPPEYPAVTNEGVIGALFLSPLLAASPLWLCLLVRRPRKAGSEQPAEGRALCLAALGVALANLGLLLFLFCKAPRYSVDFLPLMTFAGVAGLGLWLADREAGMRRRLVCGLLLVSAASGYLCSAGWALFVSSDLSREVLVPARISNVVTEGFFGGPRPLRAPLKHTLRLPSSGERPVLTWWQQGVVKGFFVAREGDRYRVSYKVGPWVLGTGEAFEGTPGEPCEFEMRAGAMFPWATSSLYNDIKPEEVSEVLRLVTVKVRGSEVLRFMLPRTPTPARDFVRH